MEGKNAENSKKKGGGGRKRDDSDSDDERSGAAASSLTSSSGNSGGGSGGGGGGGSTFDLEATKTKMAAAVERLKKALSGLHVGRASPSMLEHVPVTLVTTATDGGSAAEEGSSSGSSSNTVPLQALAAVTARNANTLVVTPFDPSPSTAASITAALRLPPLRLDARLERSGELVVPVPRATPEAVAALAKLARAEAEAARVAVRAARKDANSAARSKDFSEDARRKNEKAVQAAADEFAKKVDAALAAKEADLAAV
jgi:ribosome recycling factor